MAALGGLIAVTSTIVSTASNTVPASNLGEDLRSITADAVKPAECAGIALTTIVADGTAANDLVLGTSAGDSIRGRQGEDCVLAGAGADTLRGGTGDDILLGQAGDDHLIGNPGIDVCRGGAGTDTFQSCETEIP